MPDTRRAPRFAIASAFDARPWSGSAVMQREGGDAIAMPVFGSSEGVYDCPLAFLNGYGSQHGLDASLSDGPLTITINSADKVVIANAHNEDITLLTSPNNALWGLPTVDTAIPALGSYTAPNDWRRGMVWNGEGVAAPRLSFSIPGDPTPIRTPVQWSQDVRIGIRERGDVEDLDDQGLTTLEALDNAANDASGRFRWGVTDDGHVWWCGVDESAEDTIVWLSSTFRDRLGFTGNETVKSAPVIAVPGTPSLHYCIADRPLPGLIIPTRPIAAHVPIQTEVGNQLLLTDGSYSSSTIGSYISHRIEWVLDGPDGAVDLHAHWLELRSLYLRGGESGVLFWAWGDSRRALDPRRVTANQAGYGLLYTIDRHGYAGRLPVRLHPDSASEETVEWEGDLRLRSRQTTRLSVKEGSE